MKQKELYALIYLFKGTYSQEPFSQVMCISDDRQVIEQELQKYVAEDTRTDDEDEWNEECNFKVYYECMNTTYLQHKKNTDLMTQYTIQRVDALWK